MCIETVKAAYLKEPHKNALRAVAGLTPPSPPGGGGGGGGGGIKDSGTLLWPRKNGLLNRKEHEYML